MNWVIKLFAAIGIVLTVVLVIGVALDIRAFDPTSGGYEPPYTAFTGEPIDWENLDLTQTGVVKRGYVVNVHVNGATGMISFEIFGQMIDYRPLSDRALAVHQPREAFIRLGFDPEF